jgi:helicase associated protein
LAWTQTSPKRKKRLDAAVFVWDPHERLWENSFAALNKFKAREGHCLVPRSHIEGTFKLGTVGVGPTLFPKG